MKNVHFIPVKCASRFRMAKFRTAVVIITAAVLIYMDMKWVSRIHKEIHVRTVRNATTTKQAKPKDKDGGKISDIKLSELGFRKSMTGHKDWNKRLKPDIEKSHIADGTVNDNKGINPQLNSHTHNKSTVLEGVDGVVQEHDDDLRNLEEERRRNVIINMNDLWDSGKELEEPGTVVEGASPPSTPDGPITDPSTLASAFHQNGPSQHYKSVLDIKPPKYLTNFRNPCWYEPLPDTNPYKQDFYYTSFYQYYYKKVDVFWSERRNSSTTWRLRCLPFFHIAGVAKAGTTDVHCKLSLHQQVAPSAAKEIHWWAQHRLGAFVPKSEYVPIHDYIDLYDLAAQRIHEHTVSSKDGTFHPMVVGDASASKLTFTGPWRRLPENEGQGFLAFHNGHYIHHLTPAAHIIIMLREPAERLYSDYIYFAHDTTPQRFHMLVTKATKRLNTCMSTASVWQCVTNSTVLPALHGLQRSLYYVWVSKWLEVMPGDQLHPVRLEDYKADKINILNTLARKLGLDNFSKKAERQVLAQTKVRNASKKSNHPPMLNSTRILLRDYFSSWNRKLADLLHDDRFLWQDSSHDPM